MRLKSEIWIAALVRRVFSDGGYAAIEKRGADEAGAIFLRVRHRDGLQSILAPAPQSAFESDESQERLFEVRRNAVEEADVDALLARELSFDPDLWLVELEIENPADYVAVMPA